ncbi:LacI family DNA-binding transcriptional regulator [Dyella sp.]|uniref:LacI family DNA-binding transcriptional regulator n=1 Tax=Dyella sp. TaxID=1869338 RepID=UPI002FD96B5D
MKRTDKKSVRRKGGAVTIDEVAALAKVSPMTVSRVINSHSKVRDTTREKVMQAVNKLGYVPNAAASSLAAAQDARIALIYTDPSGAYLRELLMGTLHGAARSAAQLVIADWDELGVGTERKAARALARKVAGVILPPPLCESKTVIDELVKAGVHVVAIAAGRFDPDISSVRIDDFLAGKEITHYLIKMGHTRIACIKGNPSQSASTRRFEGYQAALKEAGIPLDAALVRQGYFTYRSGLPVAEELLALRKPPTAIFAGNDDMAAAAVSVAHRRGIDVPRDLSIVGFDDSSAATTIWPELTTIRQPILAMADAAIDILLRAIRRKESEPRVVVHQVAAHQLVLRDSVAPPHAVAGKKA